MIKLLVSSLSLMLMVCAPGEISAQVFSQDLTMHLTTTRSGMGEPGEGSSTFTNYYSKSAMRTSSPDGNDMIVRFDTQKIISIDSKKKTYAEMTFQQLQELQKKLQTEADPDEAGMEQMRKMMAQLNSTSSLTKEGPGENIAGYATEKYLLSGPIQMELWVAPSLKIPAAYYDVLKIQVPPNPLFDSKNVYDELKKIDCIALKTVITVKLMDMEMQTTTLVNSIDKGSLPASLFEVPADYRLVQK
jgi:hypothetical protein